MNVILQTGATLDWTAALRRPWALAPIGNRPWIEYWIEWCVAQGWRDIRIVLGEGAYEIERYLGDGARWGIGIRYSFLRDSADPDAFPRRDPDLWRRDGLLHVRRPVFPLRLSDAPPTPPPGDRHAATRAGDMDVFFRRGPPPDAETPASTDAAAPAFPPECLIARPIASLREYYELNMAMVDGAIARYLTPGYRRTDAAYLGYNVVTPPAARLTAPLMIGNDVILRPLCAVGPRAILGNRVIVDRQAEVADSLVLDGTYLGAGIEVRGRIVAGRRLIDPEDGAVLDLADPHLLDRVRHAGARGESLRRAAHRLLAAALFMFAAPVALPALALGWLRGGRFVSRRILGVRGPCALPDWRPARDRRGWLARLGLDRWPALLRVARGDLWLCGQTPLAVNETEEADEWPAYRPGLYSYADTRPDPDDPLRRRIEAAYYAHHRGWLEDLRILWHGWWGRLTARAAGTPDPGVNP